MNYRVLKILEKEEIYRIQELQSMKSAIEDLALVVAEDNSILKENSDLYSRLLNDNCFYKNEIEKFWIKYLEEYDKDIKEGEQLYVDYRTNELCIKSM